VTDQLAPSDTVPFLQTFKFLDFPVANNPGGTFNHNAPSRKPLWASGIWTCEVFNPNHNPVFYGVDWLSFLTVNVNTRVDIVFPFQPERTFFSGTGDIPGDTSEQGP
jgi:hypothetical protein